MPTTRRWTQEDPIGYAGGSNVYTYVDGTPLEARDPSGLIPGRHGGTRAGSLWWAANEPNPLFESFINKEVDEYAWWLPTHDAWRPRFAGRITFNGPAADEERCLAEPVCANAWNAVDNGHSRVTINYDPGAERVAESLPYRGQGPDSDFWTITYNSNLYDEAAAQAGVDYNDFASVMSHEFGHILYEDYYYSLYPNRPQPKCRSEVYAIDIENNLRSGNVGLYGHSRNSPSCNTI